MTSRPIRVLLVVAGTTSLLLGLVGIAIPLLPTTPFLLLAAACYLKGSRRMHDWLLGNRVLGQYIRDYREGRGITPKNKAVVLSLLWVTIGYSAIYVTRINMVRIILLIIAALVTLHIVTVRTLRQEGSLPT